MLSTTNPRTLNELRLVLNTSRYFLTMDGNITRCLEGQPHFAPAYVHDGQLDVRPNQNSFAAFSAQDQHGIFLLSERGTGAAAVIAPSTSMSDSADSYRLVAWPAVSRNRSIALRMLASSLTWTIF
jgi:hypothetical protein